ncbi:MAG: fluoride efflux transporter CrcB [Chitinophagales bacterium]|nr:fluoride efflux transporter CrcB [Chitinophagales bacterium]
MAFIKSILLVGLGGGAGSIMRYIVAVIMPKSLTKSFPFQTFIVNIIGCFLIGLLVGWMERDVLVNSNLKLLFITGFCGGFTTFSTFSSESLGLMLGGNYSTSILYMFLSLLLGLIGVWAGIAISK